MVGGIEGDFWQTWTGEDGSALGRTTKQRSRHMTGREETETESIVVRRNDDTETEIRRRIPTGAKA